MENHNEKEVHQTQPQNESSYAALEEKYKKFLFVESNEVKVSEPFISIEEQTISSLGNILCISGLPKTGKTSMVAALIAPNLYKSSKGIDSLGLYVHPNIKEHGIVYINTELSDADFDKLSRKILTRAGLKEKPKYFQSLNFTGFTPTELMKTTNAFLIELSKINKIRAIVFDGIADYVSNINDLTPCTDIVKYLQHIAREYDAVVIVTIHKNSGDEKGKSRGHLGSELVRKCEAVLNLTSTRYGTKISGSDTRNSSADFTPRYMKYDSEKGYFVANGTDNTLKQEQVDAKQSSDEQKVRSIFPIDNISFSYKELIGKVMPAFNVKVDSAKKKISGFKEQGILIKDAYGKYCLKK